jgi:hypothetical protein
VQYLTLLWVFLRILFEMMRQQQQQQQMMMMGGGMPAMMGMGGGPQGGPSANGQDPSQWRHQMGGMGQM